MSVKSSSISSVVRFGILQYKIFEEPQKNLRHVFSLLQKIRLKKPHYLVLPEMWLGGPKQLKECPRWIYFYREALQKIQAWCQENKTGCFFSQLEQKGKRYFNTAYFIEKDGRLRGSYQKIHLFSYGGETKIFSAGIKPKVWQTPFGKVGCIICYDLRFPELTRRMAEQGMIALVVCAQWPKERMEHWITLLRARAIENQIFVMAANRLGKKGLLNFTGHSVVFNPWGINRVHLKSGETMAVVEIDFSEVAAIRKRYPFFRERRI